MAKPQQRPSTFERLDSVGAKVVRSTPALAMNPQAIFHWKHTNQVEALIKARETEPDIGFMMRMLALCTLPRTESW